MQAITASRGENLSIGELSRLSGVNIETIRCYERVKMLASPPRTPSGRRVYASADLRTLTFIRRVEGANRRRNPPCRTGQRRTTLR
jgi:MerR family transcriptional regulator, mercuric resistance operon regulatory protein